jgi:hypothetical protein
MAILGIYGAGAFVTNDFDVFTNQINPTGTRTINHPKAFTVHGGGVKLGVA